MTQKYRELSGFYKWTFRIFSLAAILVAVKQLFYLNPFGYAIIGSGYTYLLLVLFLPSVFLLFPASPKSVTKIPWYDTLSAFFCILGPFYYFFYSEQALAAAWEFNPPIIGRVLSIIMVFLILEAGRRTAGGVFAAVMAFFAFYPLFADHMPGPLWGKGWGFIRLASYHFGSQESIAGIAMKVTGEILLGFMAFAIGLQILNVGQFFMDFAMRIIGRTRGAQAKVAVLASGLFGMISGAPVANVLFVGSFTIPAMKKAGYPSTYAAAVEACASTGGVLMPPVMGVAAFIMAEFLEIPYAKVAIAAILPSVLYYFSLLIQVDGQAFHLGLGGVPKEVPLPSLKPLLKDGLFFIISFAVLVWLLIFEMKEGQAPFYALAVLFILAMVKKKTRLGLNDLYKFIDGTGKVMAELTAILACVGFVIGSLTMSGAAISLSREIVELAGGSIVLLLLFSAGAAFILGMGVPLTPAYILLAIIMVPALVQIGLDPLPVHMFALYWANISFITPPVCIAAFTAAGIAGAPPMKTGYLAMRIGSVLFIVPFFFVLSPALLLQGTPLEILEAIPTALIGVVCWAAGMEGYLLKVGKLPVFSRVLYIISGTLLIIPGWVTDFIGIALAISVTLTLKLLNRKK